MRLSSVLQHSVGKQKKSNQKIYLFAENKIRETLVESPTGVSLFRIGRTKEMRQLRDSFEAASNV